MVDSEFFSKYSSTLEKPLTVFSAARLRPELNGEWGLGPTEWNDLDEDWMTGLYSRVNNLKKVNPNLKTILSVQNSDLWTKMADSGPAVRSFIINSLKYCRDNGFDGIELDWRYPAQCNPVQCSPETDKYVFQVRVALKSSFFIRSINISRFSTAQYSHSVL